MRILGVVLIVLGLVGLIAGGVTWTRRDKVVDVGPVEVTNEHQKSLPVPPLFGGLFLVAGVVLVMKSGRPA